MVTVLLVSFWGVLSLPARSSLSQRQWPGTTLVQVGHKEGKQMLSTCWPGVRWFTKASVHFSGGSESPERRHSSRGILQLKEHLCSLLAF